MTQYNYTIFDGVEYLTDASFEAESVGDALAQVAEFLKDFASGLTVWDYEPGTVIHALIWREDGAAIGMLTHELTVEDEQ